MTREELQKRLWPDTFVDVDHNLNTAINKIREALGDSAESPRFVETLPRRGIGLSRLSKVPSTTRNLAPRHSGRVACRGSVGRSILFGAFVFLAGTGFFVYKRHQVSAPPMQRTLTRITFDDGLQIGATWSPDGRFIAYSSDRGGKFDIWVQQVSGGDPVQITKGPGHNWQPDWSPDGKYIAYRSEEGEGGLFVVPALGGAGLERKIASFGYYPRWSPDSSQILFQDISCRSCGSKFYVVGLDGSAPREVMADLTHRNGRDVCCVASRREENLGMGLDAETFTYSQLLDGPGDGGVAVRSEIAPELQDSGEASQGAESHWEIRISISPGRLRERQSTSSAPFEEQGISGDDDRSPYAAGHWNRAPHDRPGF